MCPFPPVAGSSLWKRGSSFSAYVKKYYNNIYGLTYKNMLVFGRANNSKWVAVCFSTLLAKSVMGLSWAVKWWCMSQNTCQSKQDSAFLLILQSSCGSSVSIPAKACPQLHSPRETLSVQWQGKIVAFIQWQLSFKIWKIYISAPICALIFFFHLSAAVRISLRLEWIKIQNLLLSMLSLH